MDERWIEAGQRWRSPAGEVVEVVRPEISERGGWWVRHTDGRNEWLSDEQIANVVTGRELVVGDNGATEAVAET